MKIKEPEKIWGRITCVKMACNGNDLTQQEAQRGFKLLFYQKWHIAIQCFLFVS